MVGLQLVLHHPVTENIDIVEFATLAIRCMKLCTTEVNLQSCKSKKKLGRREREISWIYNTVTRYLKICLRNLFLSSKLEMTM